MVCLAYARLCPRLGALRSPASSLCSFVLYAVLYGISLNRGGSVHHPAAVSWFNRVLVPPGVADLPLLPALSMPRSHLLGACIRVPLTTASRLKLMVVKFYRRSEVGSLFREPSDGVGLVARHVVRRQHSSGVNEGQDHGVSLGVLSMNSARSFEWV